MSRVSNHMEQVQKEFLDTRNYMQNKWNDEQIISYLDSKPPKFRSVAYESASFEIAMRDLTSGQKLTDWKKFYRLSREQHTFHVEIGLGWAFAQLDISPLPYFELFNSNSLMMTFDGMGYYFGLFKGRRTVKSQLIPDGLSTDDLQGFDQGLGRRLWYISNGETKELIRLIQLFPSNRHADLWRGVGIACAYVGGCVKSQLQMLVKYSDQNRTQFQTGITLAVISRNASQSLNKSIELACEIVCRMSIGDVIIASHEMAATFEKVPMMKFTTK